MAKYPDISVGQRITADLLDSMVTDKIVKGSATDRSSNTTLADDPDLAGLALGVGTWEVKVMLFAASASATPDIKTGWAFTGTWTSPVRALDGPGTTSTGGPTANSDWRADGQDAATAAAYSLAATSDYSVIKEECHDVTVTVAGTFSLQWAQQTSDPTATSVKAGSYISARRTA